MEKLDGIFVPVVSHVRRVMGSQTAWNQILIQLKGKAVNKDYRR